MFTGQYTHSLDTKGRVAIPKRVLARIPDQGNGRILHGTRGFDSCIFFVCTDEWERLVEKVEANSMGDEEARQFTRVFYSWACELTVDSSGRILVSPKYRDFLGLDPELPDRKEVFMLGCGKRIEFWLPATWDGEIGTAEQDYEKHAKRILG